MTELNIDKISSRAGDIEESVNRLEALLSKPVDEFLSDWRNASSAAHQFLVALEAAAAICSHIVSRVGHRFTASYGECFEALGELGVVPKELVDQLIPLARLRNRLVHRYWQFKDPDVYHLTKGSIATFRQFLSALNHWLSTTGLVPPSPPT